MYRQVIYNEAAALRKALATAQHEKAELGAQLPQVRQQCATLAARLAQTVVIDAAKQEELARVAHAHQHHQDKVRHSLVV